jgi:hypothetical protein
MMMIAFDYAVANGVSDQFNSEKKMAGKDWLKGFCQRQNLSLSKPEPCSQEWRLVSTKSNVAHFLKI